MLIKHLFKNLFTLKLHDNLEAPNKNISKCDIKYDLPTVILYESFIPLDALVFEIGTSRPSKRELNHIIDAIIESKKLVLKDVSNIKNFFNLENPENYSGPLKAPIALRFGLIQKDKSFIFKELIRSNLFSISRCVRERVGIFHKNEIFFDPRRDKEYRSMVLRIRDVISENLEVNEILEKEKTEFYRKFQKITRVKKSKISLNLGGSILNLKDMSEFVYKIDLKDKSKVVREWVDALMAPIEDLQQINIKSFIEQKFSVIEFLKECLDRKTGAYESSFEARDLIIKLAKLSEKEKSRFLSRQRTETKKLLKMAENLKIEQWIIKYSKQIKEDYVAFLLSSQEKDKQNLMSHFDK